MPSAYVANLIIRRDNASVELAGIPRSKPDNAVDGESYQWDKLRRSLLDEIKQLNEMIAIADGGFDVGHHASTHTRGGHW